MLTIVSYLLFAATLAVSLAVLYRSLVPAMPRIIGLLSGREDIAAMPQLVLRDRRAAPRARALQPQTTRRAAA